MKNLLLVVLAAIVLTACEEKNELINLTPGDELTLYSSDKLASLPAPQERHVIIEEMTGVQCPNCPNAQKEAHDIAELYPGRINLISYHVTNKFASPIEGMSKQNFMTDAGTNMLQYLGTPPSLPIGTIDRVTYTGNTSRLVNYSTWKSYVAQRISMPVIANVEFERVRKINDDVYEGIVKITMLEDFPKTLALTLAITESKIVDAQELPTSGFDPNYEHNHVLRTVINPISGFKLATGLTRGQEYKIYFSTKLKAQWVAENCQVVAILHNKDGETLDVVQSMETELAK